MQYEKVLSDFLSTCDGLVLDVFFSIYSIIESLDETEQPAAVMYVCENALSSKSDYSKRIEKGYYTDEQIKNAEKKINKKFSPILNGLIEKCSKDSVQPVEFYKSVWKIIQSSIFKTKRERALALFRVVDHDLIPYRSVGVGLTMEQEKYESIVDDLERTVLDDTEYILKLSYGQKTQRASLLVDKLLSLHNKEEQTVYMALLINEVESNVKEELKAVIESI